MINKVICVCCKKDASTFEVSTKYICQYVLASMYVVLVPKKDYEYFASLNLRKFKIFSEDKYEHIADALRVKLVGKRFGWYFQQFIKMSELDEGEDSDINLIWDADTIPLKALSFERNGKLFFYQGTEFHPPYFELIKNLLNEEKLVQTSFIAQCLPYRVKWFRDFKASLGSDIDTQWYQKLIELIDFKEISGLSEYETLGTYAVKNFNNEIEISDNTKNWYRYGNSLIGSSDNFEHYRNKLGKKYDFISFEKWDKRKFSLMKKFFKIHCWYKFR
ncbi:MAG: hypothetical protein CMI17_05850 [Opitutaceae bacterium]|nr:hypothetical protein [Opitutaceae bacterium]